MEVVFHNNLFPLFDPYELDDVKDPCPVFDGTLWHMFGSGGTVTTETWTIFHATAAALEGPWAEQPHIQLPITGTGIAAPGVIYAAGVFHMFVQTEFMKPHGRIEHAVSNDGFDWVVLHPALIAVPGSEEHGIYDPHPAELSGQKYLVYSAMQPFERAPQPDIYLARSASNSWFGPWERLGKILDHHDLPHHNRKDDPDYEWGIEGAQLVQLPSGKILLNATCFLPSGPRGQRQRVFFAIADEVQGPYVSVGPVLDPPHAGENGHSTVLIDQDDLILIYQSRLESTNYRWRYGVARCRVMQQEAA
ncbi:hypothetical protein LH464_14765 [Neorhizobium sp. T786]|uniref:hypothetical protein n=1 Tax=Pseudorhizobium xiangyangii TaxID=2883104 RepID=UPI001D0018CA|nr:hypothetical protein [Neorhizobium xiangyangii]MCB5203736.1 hypothetical protein [Neorhizobium xiangyangii]